MERRKYPRIEFKRAVLWRSSASLDNLDHACDISEGGLCLAMEKLHLMPQEPLLLELQLPTKTVIRARARVCWIGPGKIDDLRWRVGIEFTSMDDATKNELRHFVGVFRYGCD